MAEYLLCPTCNEEVTEESDFCPHCGVVFTGAEQVRCENHPDRSGESVCIICRRVLCKACTHVQERRRFCADHKSVSVSQDWAMIFQSTEINEAVFVKSFLESSGFHVQAQNFDSGGFAWDGGGESSVSRSNLGRPGKVFVPIPEYLTAQAMLREWESGEIKEE